MTDLADLYAAVPVVPCKGLCQRSCGPIPCFGVEVEALRDNGINLPEVHDHPVHGPLTCTHLDNAGRCSIYAHRPLICRLFGAVKAMRCPHGCQPEGGYLTETQEELLMIKAQELSAGRSTHMPAGFE